jgi:hypothetical protein
MPRRLIVQNHVEQRLVNPNAAVELYVAGPLETMHIEANA